MATRATRYLAVHKRGQDGVISIKIRDSRQTVNKEIKSLLRDSTVSSVDLKDEHGEIIRIYSAALPEGAL